MNIRDFRLWALMFFVALLVMLCAPVWATGKDNDNSVTVDNEVTVGGNSVTVEAPSISDATNISTGGNRSIALGNVLGDVDIAHCLGSTQWSTPVYGKQKLTLNWVCVAEFYIRYQQPELAAMALCNTDILKEFPTEKACEEAHQFLVLAAVPTTHVEESDRVHDRQETQLMEMQSQLEQLRELYEQRPTRTVRQVEQKPLLTEEQRAKLREIKE